MAEFLPESHRLRNESFERWQTDAADSLAALSLGHTSLGSLEAQLIAENQNAFLPNFRQGCLSIPRQHRDNDNTAVIPFIRGTDTLMYLMPSFKRRLQAQNTSGFQKLEGCVMGAISSLYEAGGALTHNKWIGGGIGRDLNSQTIAAAHYSRRSLTRPSQVSRLSIFFVTSEIDFLRQGNPLATGAVANHEYVHTIDAKTRKIGRYFSYLTEARAYYAERQLLPPPRLQDPRPLRDLWELSDDVEKMRQAYGIPGEELLEGTFTFTKKHNGYHILGGKPVKFRRS